MPFKSEQQRKFMWAKHPAIARRWAKKYGSTPVEKGAGRKQVANQRLQKAKSNAQSSEPPRVSDEKRNRANKLKAQEQMRARMGRRNTPEIQEKLRNMAQQRANQPVKSPPIRRPAPANVPKYLEPGSPNAAYGRKPNPNFGRGRVVNPPPLKRRPAPAEGGQFSGKVVPVPQIKRQPGQGQFSGKVVPVPKIRR